MQEGGGLVPPSFFVGLNGYVSKLGKTMESISDSAKNALNAYEHDSVKCEYADAGEGKELIIRFQLKGQNDLADRVKQFIASLNTAINGDSALEEQAKRAFSKVLRDKYAKIENLTMVDANFAGQLANAIMASMPWAHDPMDEFLNTTLGLSSSDLPADHPLRSQPYPLSEMAKNYKFVADALHCAVVGFHGPRLNRNVSRDEHGMCSIVISGVDKPIDAKTSKDFSHSLVKEGVLPRAKRLDLEDIIHAATPDAPGRTRVITSHRF